MTPDEGWITDRLTDARRKNVKWFDLASAAEKFWKENFSDSFQKRLTDILSYYTSSKEDLRRLVSDMSAFFEGQMSSEDIALGLTWSHNELQLKEFGDILSSTLKRKLGGAETEWVPLYANKSATYGTSLKTQAEVAAAGESLDDYFLTSRGKVKITSSVERPYEVYRLLDIITESVNRIKPLHIFFMGVISATFSESSTCSFFTGVWSRGMRTGRTGTSYTSPCFFQGAATAGIFRKRSTGTAEPSSP